MPPVVRLIKAAPRLATALLNAASYGSWDKVLWRGTDKVRVTKEQWDEAAAVAPLKVPPPRADVGNAVAEVHFEPVDCGLPHALVYRRRVASEFRRPQTS